MMFQANKPPLQYDSNKEEKMCCPLPDGRVLSPRAARWAGLGARLARQPVNRSGHFVARMGLVFGSITIEGARNPQPRLDQKEYFAANCRIRGSAALCNTPNVAERMLLAGLAKFG